MSAKPITHLLVVFFTIAPANIDGAITILIEPTDHAGRKVGSDFERNISMQFAKALRESLHNSYEVLNVLITHSLDERLDSLQNATLANQLSVDLYLSIHMYQQHNDGQKLVLYQFAYNGTTDFWHYTDNTLHFTPYNAAHLPNANLSKAYGTMMLDVLLQNAHGKHFEVTGFYAIPFKPLVGIQVPAIGLEIGMKEKHDWRALVEPITQSLEPILKHKGIRDGANSTYHTH